MWCVLRSVLGSKSVRANAEAEYLTFEAVSYISDTGGLCDWNHYGFGYGFAGDD
jgi:hypothetical protein